MARTRDRQPRHGQLARAALGLAALLPLVALPARAGVPDQRPGSRSAAMAHSAVATTDGWAVFGNPAAMAPSPTAWAGVHHENRFLTPNLVFNAVGASLPVGRGVAGASFQRFGFEAFSQSMVGLAYALSLGPRFALGLRGNAHHVWAAHGYGGTLGFSGEGGLLYLPGNGLIAGVHILNPTRSSLGEHHPIPSAIRLGGSYQLGHMLLLAAGLEMGIGTQASVSMGAEFIPIPRLSFRGGFATAPSLLSFGVGYALGPLQIDLALSHHQHLGYTPHLSVGYTFGPGSPTPEPGDSSPP